MSHVVELTDQTFHEHVENGLTLVDFWAPWCRPCLQIAPVLEELAEEYQGKISIAKINVDEHNAAAIENKVMNIPTLIFFKDGEPVETVVGSYRKEIYKNKIDTHVAG